MVVAVMKPPVSQYQKGKASLDLLEQDIQW